MNQKLLFIAGALALTTVSCENSMPGEFEQGGRTTIIANAVSGETVSRSAIDPTEYSGGDVGLLWTQDDELGVFGGGVANARFVSTATEPAGRVAFRGDCPTPEYAYYPYSAANDGRAVTALTGSLAPEQSYSEATGVLEGDYKYGRPRNNAENEFDFTHIFALLKFNVEATGTDLTGEKLRSVSLVLPEGRRLAGDFTFDATVGSYSFTDNTSSKVTLNWTDAPSLQYGAHRTGYMSVAPDMKADDEITIVVRTDSHKATLTKKIAFDLEANAVYTFDLDLRLYADELTVEEAAAAPEMTSFEFTAAKNAGKILDRKLVSQNGGKSVAETAVTTEKLMIDGTSVSGMIPYLYDFTLVPDFTVPKGVKVTVGGVEQTSGVSAQDFSRPVVYTVTNSDGDSTDYTVTVSNTGLPVVVVKQSSTVSGGSWVGWFGDLSVREKTADWATDDEFAVYNADGTVLMAPQVGGMRLRGNSTRNFPKKPFAIKLDKKGAMVEGLASHKRWVLLANWLDCSMMRNNTAFAIAHATETASAAGTIGKGMLWNPHGTSVELVIDGRHVGNYYLCEQIKIDKNRVAIKDAYEDVLEKQGQAAATFANCGYLIECDDNYDENCKFITSKLYLPIMLKDDVSSEILTQLQSKINGIEADIVAGNYAAAYEKLDINSLIDQWIVFELTMNNEYKHPKSVYMTMDGGDSKLCGGPVWDFDYQTFPNSSRIAALNSTWGGTAAPSATQWLYAASQPGTSATVNDNDMPYMWYPLLFKDATFRATVQERWAAVYPYLKALEGDIAAYAGKYAKSWEVNNAMWPLNFRRSDVIGWAPAFAGDEDMTDYSDVVENLRGMYSARLDWMNSAITSGNFYTQGK